MSLLFVAIALVVGLLCGAVIGYETRDLNQQPGGLRPWLIFGALVAFVAGCAALVEYINRTAPPSTVVKGCSVLAVLAGIGVSLVVARRKR